MIPPPTYKVSLGILLASDEEKARARVETGRLVDRGEIRRRPCEVCGSTGAEMHHEDYADPRAILWLCETHHKARHGELYRLCKHERDAMVANGTRPKIGRPRSSDAEAACRDAANHGLPTADLARLTGISHRTLSDVRGRLVDAREIPPPPSGRGQPTIPGGAVSITLDVSPAMLRDVDRYREGEESRAGFVRLAIAAEVRRRAVEESARESMREDGGED